MKQVEELIRGEMSAIQSFDTVLKNISDVTEKERLSSIRQDHVRAVEKLKRFVGSSYREGKVESSGPWGAFATAFAGGASFFGDKAAIKALKMGEEYGIKDYKEALNDTNLQSDLKQVIQTELLPQQERHLTTINGYLQ